MSAETLLDLTITPADREWRGRTRMIDEALVAVTRAYAQALTHKDAVVHVTVTVGRSDSGQVMGARFLRRARSQ